MAGVFAATLGILVATNFRGFRDRFVRESRESGAWLKRVPPWRFVPPEPEERTQRTARIVGTVFAVLGPLIVVKAIVQLVRRPPHFSIPPLHPRFEPFSGLVALGMVAQLVLIFWRGRKAGGFWGDAWKRGGISRAACVVVGLGGLVMAAGAGSGLGVLFGLGWAVGAAGAVVIMLTSVRGGDRPSAGSGAGGVGGGEAGGE
ncbi:hypothetical protein [Actinomadura gamaensis]|uniref:DUF1648 domain-containing protein n=1 Tax=Actinomadura gamaensis TaxID=1763541 RepID=A0ABV9U5I5_9ACTN